MRKLILAIALSVTALAAEAQKAPTLYTPDQSKYEHVGIMVYYPRITRYLLEGRDDIYYIDDDSVACIPGDEHHAPSCRKINEWFITVEEERTVFNLEDGQQLEEVNRSCNQFADAFCEMAITWKNARMQESTNAETSTQKWQHDTFFVEGKKAEGIYLYHVTTKKKRPGEFGVSVGYADKQRAYYDNLAAWAASAAAHQPAFK